MRHRGGALDYDRPKGKQITLALTRLPAADPAAGSVAVHQPRRAGRPGVEFVQGAGPFLYSDEVRAASTWSASTPAASSAAPRCAATTPSTRPLPSWPRWPSR